VAVDGLHEQLAWYWTAMLRPRLDGLTDDEYLWEPSAGCWSVHPDGAGGWRSDWRSPPPVPAPVTTIAWRMTHMTDMFLLRANHHFGGRSLSDADMRPAGTADEGIARLEAGWASWSEGMAGIDDAFLATRSEGPPGTMDGEFAFSAVILHVNREMIHHGAEVAVLRDLFLAERMAGPLVVALLAADRGAVEAIVARQPEAVAVARAELTDLLMVAVDRHAADAVSLLVEQGWDPNVWRGYGPLHLAAAKNDVGVVQRLVEAGGDLAAVDATYGATPLGWAEFFDCPDAAAYLRTIEG
jgi:hypothetical protein